MGRKPTPRIEQEKLLIEHRLIVAREKVRVLTVEINCDRNPLRKARYLVWLEKSKQELDVAQKDYNEWRGRYLEHYKELRKIAEIKRLAK